MSFPVPDACTLPTAEQPIRQAEFQDLCTTSLRKAERISPEHLRLTLTGAADLGDSVRDLVARESQCCTFFDFTVTRAAESVVLDIKVPAAQTAFLDGLSDLAGSPALLSGAFS